jgi:hypothetical protein
VWLERGESSLNPNQECPPRSPSIDRKATHTAVAIDSEERVFGHVCLVEIDRLLAIEQRFDEELLAVLGRGDAVVRRTVPGSSGVDAHGFARIAPDTISGFSGSAPGHPQ